MDNFTWKNILCPYKCLSRKFPNVNLCEYVSSYYYKDKSIYPPFFGHDREMTYPPGNYLLN